MTTHILIKAVARIAPAVLCLMLATPQVVLAEAREAETAYVYWSATGIDGIYRAPLYRPSFYQQVTTEKHVFNKSVPTQIAVDPRNGTIYWSSPWSSEMGIYAAPTHGRGYHLLGLGDRNIHALNLDPKARPLLYQYSNGSTPTENATLAEFHLEENSTSQVRVVGTGRSTRVFDHSQEVLYMADGTTLRAFGVGQNNANLGWDMGGYIRALAISVAQNPADTRIYVARNSANVVEFNPNDGSRKDAAFNESLLGANRGVPTHVKPMSVDHDRGILVWSSGSNIFANRLDGTPFPNGEHRVKVVSVVSDWTFSPAPAALGLDLPSVEERELERGHANCPFGGTRIDEGHDANLDGDLAMEEVEATFYECLLRVIVDATGVSNSPCEQGGQYLVEGLDDGKDANGSMVTTRYDGLLQEQEVSNRYFECNTLTPIDSNVDDAASDGTGGVDGHDETDGIDGTDGVDALNGADGVDGLNGTDGADGLNGADGVAGLNGTDGVDGLNGADGVDGLNGTDGVDGLNGTDGVDGLNGADGVDGSDGADGVDGLNGTDGVDGRDGQPGLDGQDGEQGFSALMRTSPIPMGPGCAWGGQLVETGLDDGQGLGSVAYDGVLQDGEVDTSTALCNGTPGSEGTAGAAGDNGFSSLISVASQAPNANCTRGGQLISTGLDNGDGDDGIAFDGVLQSGEVDSSAAFCTATTADATFVRNTTGGGCAATPDMSAAAGLLLVFVAVVRRRMMQHVAK